VVAIIGAASADPGRAARAADGPARLGVVRSPNGNTEIAIRLVPADAVGGGAPVYRITYRGKPVVDDSPLGLTFLDGGPLTGLEVAEVRRDSRDETYPVVAGKSATARDHFNEAIVVLRERTRAAGGAAGGIGRQVEVVLRAYDDGVAFRYRLPEQPGLKEFAITAEDSGFNLPAGATAWALLLPNHTSHYEGYYQPTKVAELAAGEADRAAAAGRTAKRRAGRRDHRGEPDRLRGMYLVPAAATAGPASRPSTRAGGRRAGR
jgi:hypothetical protein